MGKQKEYPVRFTPRGLSDAWDSTNTFPGACKSLQNLIFDQSNPELVVARPGVDAPITSFAGFTTPTVVTGYTVIGDFVYGMVSTGATYGCDEPFCYNLVNNVFIAISGVTSGNVPTSPSIYGDIVPLSFAVIGIQLVITHPGFSGVGSNFFGVIDITNPAFPAWSSKNTTTNLLPRVPTAVANFNNRAWYICGNTAYYSNVLTGTVITNAGQNLTVGDASPLVALTGLPIQTSSAGVVSSLIAFKKMQIWQILGDASVTGSLSLNFLALNIGCIAPNSIVQTPIGTIFAGIDGPYYLSSLGQVLPLTKDSNKTVQDLQKPFQNIVNPGWANGAFTGSIYRICMDSVINGASATNDYWFDSDVRRWSGPHTFPYDSISAYSSYFIISHRSLGAKLFKSQYLPTQSSHYNDNGSDIKVLLQPAFLSKGSNINVKEVIESTIELSSLSSFTNYTITAFDEKFNTLSAVNIGVSNPLTFWGGGQVWGGGLLWNSASNNVYTFPIPWDSPLIFQKLTLTVQAVASYGLSIGTSFNKFRDCGYTTVIQA